jgi:hypothetical protein
MLYRICFIIAVGVIAGAAYRQRRAKLTDDTLKDARDLKASAAKETDRLGD